MSLCPGGSYILHRCARSTYYLFSYRNTGMLKQSRCHRTIPQRLWESRRKVFSLPALAGFALGCAVLVSHVYRKETERAQKIKEKESFNEKNRNRMGFFQAVDTQGNLFNYENNVRNSKNFRADMSSVPNRI